MTNSATKLSGGRGIGPDVMGPALVSAQSFGVRYDLDVESGIIANRKHDLFGQSVAGKILVFAEPKGGVAASWSLADLKRRGVAPLGIIFRSVSPIFAQGAIFAGLALIHGLDRDPCAQLKTGEVLSMRPGAGSVEICQ